MNTIEVVTRTQRAELPRTDSPESLVFGLETLIRAGITKGFPDVLFSQYFGPIERLELDRVASKLIPAIEALGVVVEGESLAHDINLIPRGEGLISRMQSWGNKAHPYGGFFRPMETILEERYVACPISPDSLYANLEFGICFDGVSLAGAMQAGGFEPQKREFHERPDLGYWDTQIGGFIANHTLAK